MPLWITIGVIRNAECSSTSRLTGRRYTATEAATATVPAAALSATSG